MNYFEAQDYHEELAVKLVNSAYRGESGKKGWTTESDLLGGQRIDGKMFKEMLQTGVILLFGEEKNPFGSVYLELQKSGVYIGMLTVSPLKQNGGIGKTILKSAENFAIEKWQVKYAKMTVISKRVELLAFYERRGYFPTGEKEPFPYGKEEFGIPKHKDLEFVVIRKQFE
jgi:GNAT superfamily N-acetyltransferase